MNRSEHGQNLEIYADNELDEGLRREFEARLADDATSCAEVARWRALRHCTQRGLQAVALPVGLEQRLTERLAAERGGRGQRIWPITGVGLAAAAVLVLAVIYTLPGSGGRDVPPTATPVLMPVAQAADFARVYELCACEHHHDSFCVAGKSVAEAERIVAARSEVKLAGSLPDFSAAGFHLAGACDCTPVKGVLAVHAHYERGARAADARSRPENVVSFFSMASAVQLDAGAAVGRTCTRSRHPERDYMVACTCDNVTVVEWNEAGASFAVCSQLPRDELVRLVETADVAGLFPLQPVGWEAASFGRLQRNGRPGGFSPVLVAAAPVAFMSPRVRSPEDRRSE